MKKEEFIFCPLGGSGEIGMNMNLFAYGNEENKKWIIVDIGVTFADDSLPGIDLIYPDPGFIVDKKDDLLGLLLTHAHEDHIGAIVHIWPKLQCNIYATPFTSVLIKEKFKEKKIDISKKLYVVDLNGKVELGNFKIEFVTLTHSILEPNGLSITTPAGTVLHTGDWKCDPNPLIGETINEKKLKEIGNNKVLAMICDSTNVFSPGRAGSESDVRDSILRIMENQTKRIIVTSFASNVARMESIFYCAKKTNRQISLVGRSMHRIYKAARQCGYLSDVIEPIDPRDAKKISRNKIVYLCTGSQGEPHGAMMRIINYVHPDVFIESGDTVIFSSKIIPGNEKKLYKLHNQLVKNNISVISEENAFVHVSGHPNREDLKDMYNWVKPKTVIPVHGEHRHMIEHINFAKEMQVPYPVSVENGDIVRLYPGDKPEVIDKAPVGRMYVDGILSVGEESISIKDRKNLSFNGFLEITIIVDSTGTIIKKPIISYKGIPFDNESSNFVFDLEDKIQNICKTYSLKSSKQEYNFIETIKINCRKTVKGEDWKKTLYKCKFNKAIESSFMYLSKLFIPILKETPSEAKIKSHQLMLRAGMIKQSSTGIYSWLPLGFKVMKKIEHIVRLEQNKIGAQELLMPTIQSADLWKESGRYDDYGEEMLRIKDRQGKEMLYGPTNEELITEIFRTSIKSYKSLPQILYHIQWKFRDELRPRFGVMRCKEFFMKDAYSFDLTDEDAKKSYNKMFFAYLNTFKRLGLTAIPMAAETGPIGGDLSHEFIILAETGESKIYSDKKIFDVDINKYTHKDESIKELRKKYDSFYAVTDEKFNKENFEKNVKKENQLITKGIEVGHIFYFGDKYSKPLKCSVDLQDGKKVDVKMGSYGIGVSRLVGAIIEAKFNNNIMKWPTSVSPFEVVIIPSLQKNDKSNYMKSEKIYKYLKKSNIDVLFDDTEENLSSKFKKFDLIGIPYQIILGSKSTDDKFEFKEIGNESQSLPIEEIKSIILNKRN